MPVPNKIGWRIAAFGAIVGLLTLIAIIVLLQLGIYGLLAAGFISVVGGAALTLIGADWYGESIMDSGTGLYNRRYFFRRLEFELSRSRETRIPIGLAVIDIDDFRQYNSRYGHIAGDFILRKAADTIRSTVRKNDIVGRWGGEEFALILPGANMQEALAVTEQVREKVNRMVVEWNGIQLDGITISGGVADCQDQSLTLIEMIDRADKAMYEAKKVKNKVLPHTVAASSVQSTELPLAGLSE